MNPATLTDVETRFRPLIGVERDTAQALLDDAWEMLTARLPHLEQNITDETVSIGNAVRVVSGMVIRVLRNPDGFVEESIDDYRYRRESAGSTGALVVTPDELSSLTPGGGRRSNSVRLVAYGDR